ncbi:hypothetical protein [Flavobacterium sp. HSC-61S13]|uniref:hypothetical protein n=1 Tax=Flavobacterium sp. HSC-61S13 TaxID=2910963 RepID=UPI0020A121E4|nr:hypothetical protein [Flavobacterium sp. HSC-61S13]MCP1997434.1 hypothetical protein [Flavobacterium sp. HSC-61S13]
MRKIIAVILFSSSSFGFAQSNENECDGLKTKNIKLEQDNSFFKVALDLRQSESKIQIDNRIVIINEVVYDAKEKQLRVSGLVENNNINYKGINFFGANFVDSKGEFHETFTVLHPSGKGFSILSSTTEVPYGFTFVFKNINAYIPVISLLQVNLATKNLRNDEFKFKGVTVK